MQSLMGLLLLKEQKRSNMEHVKLSDIPVLIMFRAKVKNIVLHLHLPTNLKA
jgi:hypothetical protein